MASAKPMRLNKAAREFNISTQTIVEFLGKKGHAIDAKPNTKLESEMVELLEKEFQLDKLVKEEAHEKGFDYAGNETVTISDIQNQKEHTPDEDYQEDIFIQSSGIDHTEKPVSPAPEPVVEKEPVVEEETTAVEETIAEQLKTPAVEEESVVEESETENVAEEKEVVEEVIETPIAEEKEAKEKVQEEPAKEEKQPVVEEEKEQSGSGPKVLGTIDLDSINQKTRPDKKSKAQKKKEAEQKKTEAIKKQKAEKQAKEADKKAEENKKRENAVKAKAEKEKQEAEAAAKEKAANEKAKEKAKEDNFIKTKYTKISGPTVVGKIEIKEEPKPGKKKKQPVASSKDPVSGNNKRKKPRTRIATGGGKQGQQPAGAQKGGKGKRGDNRKSNFNKKPVKAELTEEQIQKQMKETLARLQGGGKSKASKHRRDKRGHIADKEASRMAKEAAEKGIIKVTEFVTVNELASMMDIGATDIIKTCFDLGMFVSINQRLDAETIQFVAEEYGFVAKFVDVDEEVLVIEEEEDDEASLESRPPIITVMGHVDHGKTKLLDYIRHANVVAGEAGGITQHIGAYEVSMPDGRRITFLDTPGHEAFTAMRARGAKVTDVAIIVIAADDAVMPQTKEAITHAQAAGVPIVFAFNKIDKEGANPDRIKEQLANMNILVEDWGGKFQSQEISAITGQGIEELLEKVLLESEMLDLKANPNRLASGTVLESLLDKGRGYVTNILVQNGTIKKGDIVIAGPVYGKVKALFNERNVAIDKAGPSAPALMLGLNGAPQAGDVFNVMKDEKEAKAVASKRQQLMREQSIRTKKHITLDEIGRRLAIGDFKELNLIVKGDVDGSIEALSDELLKLSTEEVQVNVIHKAVGAITETDVMLASASNAIIIGFQVRPVPQARKLAETEQVDLRLYSIIYQAKEEIEAAIKGMLTKKTEEKIVCNIEVRDTFKVSKVGTVAGCYVLDGKIHRNTKVRLIRDGIVVYSGNLGSLKRFKDDVKEVATGYECGLNIENFNDIKVGDIIEGYEIVEID
jgi:translation initiation factor IF-2